MKIFLAHLFAFVAIAISILALYGIGTRIIHLIQLKRLRLLIGILPIYVAGTIFAIHFIDQKIRFFLSYW